MPLPFSDVPAFRRDPLKLLLDRARSCEPGFVPLCLGLRPIWLATEPALAQRVLKWPSEEVDKGRLVQTLRPLIGNSLLTNVGEAHQRTKTAVHRHVQRNALTKSFDNLVAIVTSFVARLAVDRQVTTADLAPLALQLACVALFGHDVITKADSILLVQAVQTVESEVAADMFRVLPRSRRTTRTRLQRLDHAREVVSLVVARARAKDSRSEVLKSLEQAGLNDEDLSTEILGLLIAGHHTTGATIAWLIYHLATDPSIAERLMLEADAALPAIESGDIGGLRQAPLSLAYVSEILRLYPAGWWTSREVFRPVTIGPKSFRTGDMIMVSPWQLHRDPRLWDRPDSLLLDRDLSGKAYIPFGVGPRACIGMGLAWLELQLVVLQLASAFSFEIVGEDHGAVRPRPSITLLPPAMTFRAMPRAEAVVPQRHHRTPPVRVADEALAVMSMSRRA